MCIKSAGKLDIDLTLSLSLPGISFPMWRFYSGILFTGLFLFVSPSTRAQGFVGVSTTTPAEKLDVNGAIIVRGDATAVPPVAGTIRWNAADGMHDGRTSAGEWRRLENDMSLMTGEYYTITCGSPLTTTVGGGVSTSIGSYDTPFSTSASDARKQYLYFASELTAAGFCAGNITAIGFSIITLGTPNINGWTVKIKNTSSETLSGTAWETGVTAVYGPTNITVAAGTNTFTFASPYYWDGTSNLLIEVCFDNGAIGYTGTNSSVSINNAAGSPKNRYYNLNTALSGCTIGTATASSAIRPNIIITGVTNGPTPTTSSYIYSAQPWVVGTPTLPAPYTNHGPGSVTAQGLYDDNTLLSDYVFDAYFDGRLAEQDMALHAGYKMANLDEMICFMEEQRHLPTIKGRKDWEQNGKFSVGELSSHLWETSETQALYILELNKRLDALHRKTEALEQK